LLAHHGTNFVFAFGTTSDGYVKELCPAREVSIVGRLARPEGKDDDFRHGKCLENDRPSQTRSAERLTKREFCNARTEMAYLTMINGLDERKPDVVVSNVLAKTPVLML
jgi:hypothetical protein